jgi:hypothetical protein
MVVAVADNGKPVEVDSETFAINVEAAPVATGDLMLSRALWNARSQRLFAMGSGAVPGEPVSIVDADSGALLGVTQANRRGAFRLAMAPFIAPCSIGAQRLDAKSATLSVTGAPADCGKVVLTHVSHVEWECEDSELQLEAQRAPASGSIDVSDAATGALLGSVPADHRGRVEGHLMLPAAPLSVKLVARSADASWDLGTFDVVGATAVCTPEPAEVEDDDADEHGTTPPAMAAPVARSARRR